MYDKVKILYVCRLYSGFEESLKTGIWNPKGAPTIARMIEHLDSSDNYDITIILTQKSNDHSYDLKPIQNVKVEGLSKPITVLAGSNMFPKWLWKFQEKFSDIYQLFKIISIYKKLKPDIVYCDRVNIVPAALLSRYTNARVIWRVMGVLQIMRDASLQDTLRSKFKKWLWRSPLSAVICTMDGSNGTAWLGKSLNEGVPCHMLLNGVAKNQKPDPSIELPQGKDITKILFVGRLEPMKGTKEFIDAFIETAKNNPKIHAIIAGDGSLLPVMKEQAKFNNIENQVSFLGGITPNQLKYVRQSCDFYVSLNTHGNLSNVNLEALYDELPTIIPLSQPEKEIDIDTDNFVPKDVFYRFGAVGDKAALVKAMEYMANENNRAIYQANMQKCAQQILPSWQHRIEQELNIFTDVAKSYDLAIVIADLGSGGAQKVATSLIHDLNKQGHKIAVITLADNSNDFFQIPDNVKRITLDMQDNSGNIFNSIISNVRRVIALRCALKNISPDKTISFIAPTNVLTVIASTGLNTHTIISERNDPARQSFGRFWDTLRVICYRFANQVSANSSNAIESMRSYVPQSKLVFVPNALPKPDQKYVVSYDQKEKVVLIVGRLHPQKAHNILIDAFAKTLKTHLEWSLVIAGDGPLKEKLKQQVVNLGLENNITFTGVVKNPNELYAKASIFALPSLHEGTPNALLEAMSCGVAPIISDACEGAFPYITHEKSGLIVPVNNVEALADAINKLMSNQEFCQNIGSAALKKISPLYEKTTADLWADILEKCDKAN